MAGLASSALADDYSDAIILRQREQKCRAAEGVLTLNKYHITLEYALGVEVNNVLRGVLLLVVNLIILAMVKSPEVVDLAALLGLTLDGKVLILGVVLSQ